MLISLYFPLELIRKGTLTKSGMAMTGADSFENVISTKLMVEDLIVGL